MSSAGKEHEPNLKEIYNVLKSWSEFRQYHTYSDLSHAYYKATGEWFEPHGSWDFALGQLNIRLSSIGAPSLSALVVLKHSGEPGGNFWESAPNVPFRPTDDIERLAEWSRIVKDVFAYSWPSQLP